MSVGLFIITHGSTGAGILQTATAMLEVCPLQATTLAVGDDADPDAVYEHARGEMERLDTGAGVLILTDIYGSTPSNIAMRLLADHKAAVIPGLNLPMLIRVLNYPRMDLEELSHKALSGGRDGILLCKEDPWS